MRKVLTESVIVAFCIFLALIGFSCSNDNLVQFQERNATIVGLVKPDTVKALVRALQIEEKGRDETNAEGFFEIKNLRVGIYTLEVTASGFRKYLSKSITVFDGGTTTVGEIRLSNVPRQILFTYPQDGQTDFNMHSAIQIRFTEPMDRQSLEAALSISPSVDFTSSLGQSSQSFSFQPSPRFQPDTEYLLSIGKGALTANGDSLELAYQFRFTTQPVQVTSHFPASGALFIRPHATIGFSFNTFMNLESVQSAFSIEPEIFGSFRWSDFTRLTVIPANSFFADTEYRVALGNEAVDFEGVPLKEALEFSFTTEPLRVTDHRPNNQQTLVETDATIFISFNAGMDQNSVQTAFSLNPETSGDFQRFTGFSFRFRPSAGLQSGTEYVVQIDTTAVDLGGASLTQAFSFSFNTRP